MQEIVWPKVKNSTCKTFYVQLLSTLQLPTINTCCGLFYFWIPKFYAPKTCSKIFWYLLGMCKYQGCPLLKIPNQNTHLDLRDGESYSGDESRLSLLLSLLQPQAGSPTAQSDKTNRNQHMLTNMSCYHNINNPQWDNKQHNTKLHQF
jgi:hypothetical protein